MKAKIGHYDIVTELGRGGMGVVYKGHESALNRYVAIKVLSPALAHDESIKERFLREARSMAALNDPHIIQIFFIGEDEGQPFFAMEFVEGESLSSYLKRERRMSPESAARAIMQTATGLASAHDRGVIHRDIKPGNLMLDMRGRIKIADFGIALQNDLSKKLTSTGEFVGTPGYLSPEVCTGQRVDQRSDIFSLGIVLFELLAGRMPFTDESPLGLLLEVVRAEIPDVRQLNSEVDAELTRILQKMTAKDPDNRYQTCHELAAELAAHPLVMGRQTVVAKPEISAAAATVFGMRTPGSGAAVLPPSVVPATPPPAAVASAVAPPVAPVRPSVLEREDRRRSPTVWPIAAVLLLGALGVGAYAMRERIPFLKSDAELASVAPAATSVPASTAGVQPATNEAATSVATNAPGTETTAVPPPPVDAVATQTPAAPDTSASRSPDAARSSDVVLAANDASVPNAATEPATPADESTSSRGPLLADRSEDPTGIAPLRRVAESRRGALAKVTPPVEPAFEPRPKGPPKVAVIAIGDPSITGPAEQAIEEALIGAGLLLADEDMVPGLRQIIEGGRTDLPRLFGALARGANVRAVTVIKAEPLGSTQLNYYGQSDTLYSVQLTVRSYDVLTRSPINAGFRSKVDFTQLNAEEKTREALEPQLGRLTGSLAQFRPRGGGG